MLLGKGKAAKVLDERQDLGMVAKLVEELRQALLLYQVGIVENRQSSRIDERWIAIATTVHI